MAATTSFAATYVGPGDGTANTGYIGAQTQMKPGDAGVEGDALLTFNVTSGYFGNGNDQTILFSNANFQINELTINNGYSNNQTWFTGTAHGSGNITVTGALGQDFVFTGNMQNYSGNISISSSGGSSPALGSSNNSVLQFGGTDSGGTVAQGTVTTDGTGRWINNVSGSGDLSVNNLVFNYGTGSGYDYVKVTNDISVRKGLHFQGDAHVLASGTIAGDGWVNKVGAGSLTLTGANSYTGGTIVALGELIAAHASALGTGTVAVNGGILSTSVANVNTGAFSLAGGTLVINGASAGTITLSPGQDFNFTAGLWQIDLASGLDQIIGSGAGSDFTISGGVIDLGGGAIDYTQTYDLIAGFENINISGVGITGYDTANWQASINNNGELSFTAVPEPATYGLLGAGALAAASMVRRRRRKAAAKAAE